eukprot:jgi/Undpi1/7758/HiC_scaffold_23.g10231.m1
MHEASIANSSNKYAARILSDKHWTVIEYIVPLLDPFMLVHRALEAEKYVTLSLVVPNIQALRLGLRDGMEELQAELPVGTLISKAEEREIVLPCALALFDDCNRRWGDGSAILQYRVGPRQQPQGFTRWEVVATALDRRTEKDGLWELVKETAALVLEEWKAPAGVSAASVAPTDGATAAPSKKPRLTKLMAAMQSRSVNPPADSGDGNTATGSLKDGVVYAVRVELLAFRKVGGMLMFNEKADAKGVMRAVYNNPPDMWRNKAIEFPYLARVARRALAIPATQAQFERMFSTAGFTVSKWRGSLNPDNVEFFFFSGPTGRLLTNGSFRKNCRA